MVNFSILSPRNVDVDELNYQVTELLDSDTEKEYYSLDNIENCVNDGLSHVLSTEYLNSLNPPSLPPHNLKIRTFSIVMVIRNLNVSEGLCNGTRLLVLGLGTNILKCEILTGDKAGNIVFINRITLYSENDYDFTFKRRQFTFKLSFVMTINKAQGQTMEQVSIDLRKPVFCHGHLYVACSRVRKWKALTIYLNDSDDNKFLKNIVYKELIY